MLLFHRGLGTNGEMDSVAAEQASFAEWCSTQAAERAGADTSSSQAEETHGDAPQHAAAPRSAGNAPTQLNGTAGTPGDEEPPDVAGMPLAEVDRTIEEALGMRAEQDSASASTAGPPSLAVSDGVQPPPPAHAALQVRQADCAHGLHQQLGCGLVTASAVASTRSSVCVSLAAVPEVTIVMSDAIVVECLPL